MYYDKKERIIYSVVAGVLTVIALNGAAGPR
jgi:hypothetical protein